MRWSFNTHLATASAVAIVVLVILFCSWPKVNESSRNVQRQTKDASLPNEYLASIQRALKTERELDTQVQLTVYYQGPVLVRVAWREPDFLYIHVGQFGDNPEQWYWYENQKLCVYEDCPVRGVRGICVTNILQIAEGNAERAFELVLSKSENVTYYGKVGVGLLRLIQDAATDRLEINETETTWLLKAATDAFDTKRIEPFLSGTEDRTFVVFELPRTARIVPEVDSIRVWLEIVPNEPGVAYPPEAAIIARFETIQFSLDRERLTFPKPPIGAMKAIELDSVDEINVDIMYSVRFTPNTE